MSFELGDNGADLLNSPMDEETPLVHHQVPQLQLHLYLCQGLGLAFQLHLYLLFLGHIQLHL